MTYVPAHCSWSIVPAMEQHAPMIAALLIAREQIEPDDSDDLLARVRSWILDQEQLSLTAWTSEGIFGGFARARWLELPPLSARTPPSGWYLNGIIIQNEFRRQGLGTELTRLRLDWLNLRTRTVYYFANSRNQASIALHASFGFALNQQNIEVPGVSFRQGVGMLFKRTVQGADSEVL